MDNWMITIHKDTLESDELFHYNACVNEVLKAKIPSTLEAFVQLFINLFYYFANYDFS